jgi:3-hydroxyisobutyrate dehydrogenase
MASIGFIGLGNMGAPMAANLVKAGHGVTGYDLNPAALRTLMAAGGRGAGSASEAAKGADVVITMLPAGEDVREVWLHQGGLIAVVGNAKNAKPLLIDCSTIDWTAPAPSPQRPQPQASPCSTPRSRAAPPVPRTPR